MWMMTVQYSSQNL
uniref:Uncharacterized protein n=1 Tax=Megaselia scalaris TaxID=36166 RepID=T1GX95_MEGSC